MSASEAGAPAVPEINDVTFGDLRHALRAGWADFLRAPIIDFVFALVYVLGGWLVTWALTAKGQLWWTLPASAGFPILGPFIACGYYEISRRLEAGESFTFGQIAGVIFRQKDRQIPSMAAVVVIFFLFWNFLAHMIFALFLGTASLTNITSSLAVFGTAQGATMLVVGTAIGAVFAALLFSLTVVSLPLLLDREIEGFGFALSCDFLKELGYVNFPKPDIHLHDIFEALELCQAEVDDYQLFKAIIRLASNADVTPYAVDKVFWLIGSGNFYDDPEIGSIGNHKQDFIEFARLELLQE